MRVIWSLFALSTLLGVIAYAQYVSSEKTLIRDVDRFVLLGQTADSEICVDELIRWRDQCKAMKSLCDVSAPRLMEACLASQNRKAYCLSVAGQSSDAHFGFAACQAREINAKTKNACTMAYRTIGRHCLYLRSLSKETAL